ncbi:hypothetical protein TeGR_g7469 [Tetraparma gracilis]|uniref:Uncharacterized protein n=1 Tax=Tetraparma gracilis TaxID=2962635 RepID=A0ABQ6MXD1_9STRA|nr:hypothetical protein TeGR_g7469 [Tetraparma gracilis]
MPHPSPAPVRTHRFGVGFERPTRELFSDTTPNDRLPLRDALSSETCTLERSGRVRFNPPAGTVRSVELGGKWMEFWNARVEADTVKARGVLYDKRIFGLGKQTAAGLLEIGVKYEMTSLANIIRDGQVMKEEGVPPGVSEKRRGEFELGGKVVDAVAAFDLMKVADLLGVAPERPKTFGNSATRR